MSNSKFIFKAKEIADSSQVTIEMDAFSQKDWLEGAEYGYKVGLTENNELLLKEAFDIIKIVSQRWSNYTTGEKAKEWINKYHQRTMPSE